MEEKVVWMDLKVGLINLRSLSQAPADTEICSPIGFLLFRFQRHSSCCRKPAREKLITAFHTLFLLSLIIWSPPVRKMYLSGCGDNAKWFHCYRERERDTNGVFYLYKCWMQTMESYQINCVSKQDSYSKLESGMFVRRYKIKDWLFQSI